MSDLKINTPLRADQIEFRIQSINLGGYAKFLAYKNARVDMDRLDAVYGQGYWQRHHKLINGKEFCAVSIWNKQIEQWVSVEDCGTKSNTEAEKGESSDAFKRACFNLGIGRELYAYPSIVIKLNGSGQDQKDEWYKKQSGNKQIGSAGWGLNLNDWVWYIESDPQTGHPTFIGAIDGNRNKRFQYGAQSKNKV